MDATKFMIEKFLDYLRDELNRSGRTVESYEEDLRSFERFFKNIDSQLSWQSVDADVIRQWMESMMDKGNNAASVNRRLSALRSFFRFALSRKLVESDPAHLIKGPKKGKRLPQFVRENEMDALLDKQTWGKDFACVRARIIIMVFYETGIRVSELCGLNDQDVSLVNQELKVTGKRDKQRVIPFGEELADGLKEYIRLREATVERQCDALFVTEKGARITLHQVYKIVREQLQRVCSLKKRSPHVLRHTFATAMLNHNANLESVKKLLGHARLSTTEIYTHTTFEQLKKVYENAHPRA